jgi:hypothetical protein
LLSSAKGLLVNANMTAALLVLCETHYIVTVQGNRLRFFQRANSQILARWTKD